MTRTFGLFWLLAASVAANFWFLGRTRSVPRSQIQETARSVVRPSTWRSLYIPELVDPSKKYASLNRAQLEQRLTDVETRLGKLRTPEQQFMDGRPSPETLSIVRPYLDKVFESDSGVKIPYVAECRGGACRIYSQVPMSLWMNRLQSLYPDRARFVMIFHEQYAFIQEVEPGIGSGMWLWWAIVAAAKPAVAVCTKTPAIGHLIVQLTFDNDVRQVKQSATGSLIDHSIAHCIRAAFDDAIIAIPVPLDATAIYGDVLEFRFPSAGEGRP